MPTGRDYPFADCAGDAFAVKGGNGSAG